MKLWSKIWTCSAMLIIGANVTTVSASGDDAELSPNEQLGRSIFFDRALSINENQSCATCHAPQVGWTGPLPSINEGGAVYEGSIKGRFGARKPPTSAYATLSPILSVDPEDPEGVFSGGNFWDGRATGEKLGNPAADQAQGPFLNPVEQALPDSACVVYRVCNPRNAREYPVGFEEVWGEDACDIDWPTDVDAVCSEEGVTVDLLPEDREKVDLAYDQVALSIEAFEDSGESNAFTSKYDAFQADEAQLTDQELRGLALFKGKALCANCHVLDPGPSGEPPLFTDFTFDNLGVPRNPENPVYEVEGEDWIDPGLGGFLATRPDYEQYAAENDGKHKVPTLRNVDKRPGREFVKAYMHNGYFKTLWQVVHFYNTRDVKDECEDQFTEVEDALADNCWPEAEVADNVNDTELGVLKLSTGDENAIVAFMKTLSDGFIDGGNGKHDHDDDDDGHHGRDHHDD